MSKQSVITGIILTLIFGISLSIRIFLPYEWVFFGDSVRFPGVDPWWYMRLVDNLVHNFPHLIPFDPYSVYPSGGGSPTFPGFAYMLASVIWAVGLGSPGEATLNTVAAYFPAVLGALLIIPVYFIGKEVFNRWVGILSAALIAILPGTFLCRTLLGFTDHHVAEIFFTTLAIMFLILATRRARRNQILFSHLWHRDWKTVAAPLTYSLLAGISLGIYLASWQGGLLFVVILTCYLILQFIIDHLRHNSTDYLCITGTLTLLIASVMIIPLHLGGLYQASLSIAIAVPLILSTVSHLMANRAKPVYYPLALAGLGLVGLAAFYFINPSLLSSMVAQPGRVFSAGELGMVGEMKPLLFFQGYFSLEFPWASFTTGFFISFLSLGLLAYAIKKEGSADKTLLLTWCTIMLIAALAWSRFAYYLAVNVALLTGYFSWKVLEFAGFRESATATIKMPEEAKRQKAKVKSKKLPTPSRIKMALAAIIVFFLVFFPNIGLAKSAAEVPYVIDDGWYNSLLWLKDNTPEPFEDPDYYYQLYEAPPHGETYEPPPSAYSIVAPRDVGYWITRIAHRIPNHNPGGASDVVARFFTSQDEASANQIIDELGGRYVMIDYLLTTGKFLGLAIFAGEELSHFYDTYYQPTGDGSLQPVTLYHPEYYRSMTARLYNFEGKAVTPENSTVVISYRERVDKKGQPYREIISAESFPTYEAARDYVANQDGNYRIVGTDPMISPVPLEELKHYKLVHSSEPVRVEYGREILPFVKTFEYSQKS